MCVDISTGLHSNYKARVYMYTVQAYMMYNLCLQTHNMPSSSLDNHLHFPADTAIVTSRLSLWEGQALGYFPKRTLTLSVISLELTNCARACAKIKHSGKNTSRVLCVTTTRLCKLTMHVGVSLLVRAASSSLQE